MIKILVKKTFEKLKYTLYIHEGQKLLFRKRKTINLNGEFIDIIYIVGYQIKKEDGQYIRVLNYLHTNGEIGLDDDKNNLVVLEEEK
jgi:hypothetical protein